MEAIKTIGLTKKYKDLVAVDQLNLSIAQGELFSLLGVNGAGKTTAVLSPPAAKRISADTALRTLH